MDAVNVKSLQQGVGQVECDYVPAHYLPGVVEALAGKDHDFDIELIGVGHVRIIPQLGRFVSDCPDLALFCGAAAEQYVVRPCHHVELSPDQLTRPLEDLLWLAGQCAAKGRRLAGVSDLHPLGLTAWPNLIRLGCSATAIRICALLSRSPVTIPSACRLLSLSQNEVHNVVAAAKAAGVLRIYAARPPSELAELPAPATPSRAAAPGDAADTATGALSSVLAFLLGRIRKR